MSARFLPAMLSLAITTFLAACGGGGDDSQAPGTLVAARSTASHTPADVDAATAADGQLQLAGNAVCGVSIRHVDYATRDPQGAPVTASAAVMVPMGTGADCNGARPVLLYAHGTTTLKSYDMSNPKATPESRLVEAFFAAHGYVVIAPNYLGYDTSNMSYHPYLNAEVQAADMIDGLRAGLAQVAATGGTQASKQLFVSGYSQGGHVAMATHKVLERDHAGDFPVTAAAPMSGPYNLVQFGDTVTSPTGSVNIGGELFMPYLLRSYQNSYGGVYANASDVYQSPFDKTAPTIFPTDVPVATLMADGALPNDPSFQWLFGTGGLLTDAFRASYPSSNFRKALQTNTLLGWSPKAPVALCGGGADPTVYFTNTTSMQADFATRGITVPSWNLEDRASLPAGKSYDEVYDGFQLLKLAAGANAQAKYHGELVPPFCYAMARGFFEPLIGNGG
jgi:poly(3-hydroxybutyrate) depolymerase